MTFGKAIAGGAPMDQIELGRMKVDHLASMKAKLTVRPLEKTDDLLSKRVSEELVYAGRLLETVETELAQRGTGKQTIARLEETGQMLTDLSNIVDAKDRCAGIERVEVPDMKRRLLRRGVDGGSRVCGRSQEQAGKE
jgi:hypothetical protein